LLATASRGIVRYHRPSDTRQAYRIDADGEVGRLDAPPYERVEVDLHDVRRLPEPPRFHADGLKFVAVPPIPTPVPDDPVWRAVADAAVADLLGRSIDAEEVLVFDHTVRVDDPASTRRPARNVHTDYSPDGARARLADLLGAEEAARWEAGHYAFVNVWRPVGGVVHTAPLGFVRPSTVRPEDWVLLDLVYPHRTGQILGLTARTTHEWWVLSDMRPDEAAVFTVFDNRGRPPLAHSAIDLPTDGPRRTSLESRALVRF